MSSSARASGLFSADSRVLVLAVCLVQAGLISLPFLRYGETGPLTVVIILVSIVALLWSVTHAVLYLCFFSVVVPTWFFEKHLSLPLGFKFYEGLLVLIGSLAFVSWLQEGKLNWQRRTQLDRPVLVLLGLVVFSMALGQYYGQSTSQMLRDVRYPLYYGLFFVVTGFFDVRRSRTFLDLMVVAAVVVGVEYLAEFLHVIDLSVSGSFYRVARIEGLMMPIGVLIAAAMLTYDAAFHRRLLTGLATVPVGIALVLTVGRGMWIATAAGFFFLGVLVVKDPQPGQRRVRRLLTLLLVPLVVVSTSYLFQRATRTGVGFTAVRRLTRIVDYQQDHSISGRLVAYRIALEKIRQHPLLGAGHGVTVSYLVTDRERPFMLTGGSVDSLYLTIALRMGIVGVAAFLWVFLRALRMAYGLFQRTEDEKVRLFCVGFIAVYGAMLIYGAADPTMFGNRLIFLHATFLGILARLDAEAGGGVETADLSR